MVCQGHPAAVATGTDVLCHRSLFGPGMRLSAGTGHLGPGRPGTRSLGLYAEAGTRTQ